MKSEIRKSTVNDLEQVQEIARRTIDSDYRSFLGDKNIDWFIGSGASDQYLRENIEACWVLDYGNAIVGFYMCKGNLIDLIMVDCDFHRKGYGSELLKHCERRLFLDFEEITLESFEDNDKANDFYRKHGWIEKERIFDKATNTYKFKFIKRS